MDIIATSEAGLSLVAEKLRSLGAQNVHTEKVGKKSTIVASNANRTRTVFISTRTRAAGTWQTSIDYGRPAEEKQDETNFWIFVDLMQIESPQLYIVPEWWIANDIYEVHQRYLEGHGGRRLKNDDSKHHAVTLQRIQQWHDQWAILGIS